MPVIGVSLFAGVLHQSRIIDRQLAALTALLARNVLLRLPVQGAVARLATMSDQTLR